MNATIRRYEAWRSLLDAAPEGEQQRTRTRKRPTSAAASKSAPKAKKPRAAATPKQPRVVREDKDEAIVKKHLTPRVWAQHYGTVSKWMRDGGEAPLVLDTPPTSTTKKVYDMTIDQVHALTALKVVSLTFRQGCRLSRFGVVDQDNTTLRVLHIDRNESFAGFDVSIVGGLRALEVLEVVDCSKFIRLPEDIGRMTSLRVLRIAANYALRGVLPLSIFDLHQLEVLDISYFKVAFTDLDSGYGIPGKIKAMVHLKELKLNQCNILNLWSSSFMTLVGLEKLLVFSCDMNGLPDGLGQLTGLTHLRFSYSDVKALPDEIGRLKNLREIDLLGNYELDAKTILPATRSCRMLENVKYDRRDPKTKDPLPSQVTAIALARRNYRAALDVLKCRLHVDTMLFPTEIMVRIAALIYGLSEVRVESVVCRAKEKSQELIVIE